eukprot:CAMPEP_0113468404 /NCGR_PEP_ID=MMETSP0014_2-20120614/15337_1 /TAXON_ID=2857 /ORGANISM="Nitzschia sp." /LENGTH=55 /DNA_ID=CAMNT_0000360791 /DNA_START=6 /DNA_END=173 /DNA_ORIENTATION=- /assembly_acc=CAM_ASM_000159
MNEDDEEDDNQSNVDEWSVADVDIEDTSSNDEDSATTVEVTGGSGGGAVIGNIQR